MDTKLQQYRKIMRCRAKKYDTNTIAEESKSSDNIKRKNSYEAEPISVKQKKDESETPKREKEIIEMNAVKEDEDPHNYEEDFDDDWEDEEVINPQDPNKVVDEEGEWEDDDEVAVNEETEELTRQFNDLKFSDAPVIFEPVDKKSKKNKKNKANEPQVFLGTDKDLKEGEVLDYDNEAYDLFHRMTTDWPCLSFDILIPGNKPQSGAKSQPLEYPLTIYTVAGSQAPDGEKNSIYVMKWSELHKTKYDDDSEVIDEEDVDNDEEAITHTLSLKIDAPVNRIRAMNGCGVVALWGADATVSIYNCTKHLETLVAYQEYEEELLESEEEPVKKVLQNPKDPQKKNFLVQKFEHNMEGFAIQWSPHTIGLLASGTCKNEIYFYKPLDENGSSWIMDNIPYTVHKSSVEDLQFSPNHESILASCSSDGTIKFIDFRANKKNEFAGNIKASTSDVNVISWNSYKPNLLASGCDDGSIQIWDIRYVNKGRSIAEIQWHKQPITSIDFQPFEDSVVSAACADNRITVWDFSVEADVKHQNQEIPGQLMFIHQGIIDVKEIKHHPSMAEVLVSTAENGFNVFKPNYEDAEDDQ